MVALLATITPRTIELHVKRARQSLGRKAKTEELKASALELHVTERLLQSIAEEDVAICAVIVDKRVILRPPKDPEDIYREAVTKVVAHCLKRWPRMELFLDKRYTNRSLRDALERVVREGVATLRPEVLIIHQEDSRSRNELQAVDHVAWAIFQKYEAVDHHFYDMLAERIVVEEVVEHRLW